MPRSIAALLDTETAVPGVTTGEIRSELKSIAVISRAGSGRLDISAGDLALTAGWGYRGKGGITMPGKGRVIEHPYTPNELQAIEAGAIVLRLTYGTPYCRDPAVRASA